VPAGSGQAVSH